MFKNKIFSVMMIALFSMSAFVACPEEENDDEAAAAVLLLGAAAAASALSAEGACTNGVVCGTYPGEYATPCTTAGSTWTPGTTCAALGWTNCADVTLGGFTYNQCNTAP